LQTVRDNYFTSYRSLKLTRDAEGVLVAQFHTGAGGEFIPGIDFASFGNVADPGVLVSTKSGVARTNFISLAGHNLAVNWTTGSRPNVSSRLSGRADRIESEPSVAS